MKVLLLTCSTGEGHNSAAYAVQAALARRGADCVIQDPVSFRSERMGQLTAELYNNLIRSNPELFGAVYRLGAVYADTRLPSPVYWANARYAGALREYIQAQGFDAVVCTHLFGMEALTAIRKDPAFTVPCFGVMTDYVCIPFMSETRLTGFFAPSEETRQDLIDHGAPPQSVRVTGIPVGDAFVHHRSQAQARQLLGLPQGQKLFLVMSGGVGCENTETLCAALWERFTPADTMIVCTGRNQALRDRLDARYGDSGRVLTVPFTKQVADYMAAADVLLTKSGGLSSAEAAALQVPLVHIHTIPGCETYNAEFFSHHGMSCWARDDTMAACYARELVDEPLLAQRMREKQSQYGHPDAADQIAEEVIRYVQR